MKKTFILFAVFFFILSTCIFPQTITSTAAGGAWETGNTWVGGVVPGANNDVVIAGTVSITNSNTACKNLTVNSGAILQNGGAYGWVTPSFNGKITNNGTIRNDGTGRELWMYTYGDIHNNGVWENRYLYLSAATNQTMSQSTGKSFNVEINRAAPNYGRGSGRIVASSDLTFNKSLNFQVLDNSWGVFDLGGHNLVLSGEMRLYQTTVENINEMNLLNGAYLEHVNVNSDVHLKGTCNINNSTVYFRKTTTVDGILQNGGSYGWVIPSFKGKIINNGTIRNDGSGRELWLYTYGDIHNNGVWENRYISLSGPEDQTLSQTTGKSFNAEFNRTGPDYSRGSGNIVAGSDITFNKNIDLQLATGAWGVLNAANYSITFSGSARIYQTVIRNIKDLIMNNGAWLENISIESNVNLKGTCNIGNTNVFFKGAVTVIDTLQNSGPYGWVTPTFSSQVTNNGVVRNNPEGRELWMTVNANLGGSGLYKNSRTYLNTEGLDRRVSGSYQTNFYLKRTGNPSAGIVKFYGKYQNTAMTQIEGGTVAEISNGCEYTNNFTFNNYGSLSNKGTVYSTRKFNAAKSQKFYNLDVDINSATGLDSMEVTSYGDQVPSSFGNAVKAWWRIRQHPNNVFPTFGKATFYYEDALLNGNDEASLKLFHSADSGKTWIQISTTTNLTINTNSNFVSIADVPAYGDYILSSEANPYSVKPVVIVSVIGRSQLRIGPPNRYTINYANNSTVPLDDFMISIACGSHTKILKAEIPLADGTIETFPVDSLNMEYEDSVATFFAAGLGPGEEYSFDLICTGKPLSKSLAVSPLVIDPFSIVAGAIIVYTGKKIINYMGDKAVEKIDKWEVLTPAEKEAKRQIWGEQIQEEIKRDKLHEVKVWTGKKVGQYILTKTMGVIGGTVEIADAIKNNVIKVNKSLRQKVWDWFNKETGLYGVTTTESGTFSPEVAGTSKKLQGVTSWDPNEKNGPAGYGDKKYITSGGRMHYQILFENKKEATDAAYQIVILDTLSQVFDPTTVEFEGASHPGFTTSVTDNVVKWEIIGIELPPNATPPEGEGYVSFSVKTKDGLESGTAISNQATITFDLNKPITTNLYSNTLDFTAPVTNIAKNIVKLQSDTLVVTWSADDKQGGSGISSTTVFCAVDGGAYQVAGTTNQNSFKYGMTSGLHKYSFYALSTDNVGNVEKSVAGTASVELVTAVDDIPEIPLTYELFQNYPNPFNPVSEIRYSILNRERVNLTVYDILGREVKVLVNQEQQPGTYTVSFDGKNLASGVYIYRLKSGNFTSVKKMMLLK